MPCALRVSCVLWLQAGGLTFQVPAARECVPRARALDRAGRGVRGRGAPAARRRRAALQVPAQPHQEPQVQHLHVPPAGALSISPSTIFCSLLVRPLYEYWFARGVAHLTFINYCVI